MKQLLGEEAPKNSFKSPSLAEIEEKLKELAMTGGFGISMDDEEVTSQE